MNSSSIPAKVIKYCCRHGFTDPFRQDGHWWAFPPHGVMPIQLPIQTRSEPIQTRSEPIQTRSEKKLTLTAAIYTFALAIVCIAGYVLQRKWLWLQQPVFALRCSIIFYSTYMIISSPANKFQKVYASLMAVAFFASVTAGAIIGGIKPTALLGGLLGGTFAAATTAQLRRQLRAQQS